MLSWFTGWMQLPRLSTLQAGLTLHIKAIIIFVVLRVLVTTAWPRSYDTLGKIFRYSHPSLEIFVVPKNFGGSN